MDGGGAGRSAEEESRRLRRRAEQLEARAHRYELGADGERRTAAVLDARLAEGWFVRHDLALPGSRANIDHVVVTQAGVFVVDSKNWTGSRISAGDGTLWVGRYPKRRELEVLAVEVAAVDGAIRAELGDSELRVRGVICLTATRPERPALEAGPVTAVGVDDLAGYLARLPPVLTTEQVASVAEIIDRRLPSRSGATTSLGDHGQLGTGAPPRQPRRPSRTGSPGPDLTGQSGPSRAPRPSQVQNRAGRELLVLIAVLAICAAALLTVVPKMVGHIHLALPRIPSPSTTTVPTPVPVRVSWSCPTAAKGWTATVSWPPGHVYSGTTELETAPSAGGPWTAKAFGVGSAPFKLTGLAAGQREWVRAGSEISLIVNRVAIMSGEIVAPPGC